MMNKAQKKEIAFISAIGLVALIAASVEFLRITLYNTW